MDELQKRNTGRAAPHLGSKGFQYNDDQFEVKNTPQETKDDNLIKNYIDQQPEFVNSIKKTRDSLLKQSVIGAFAITLALGVNTTNVSPAYAMNNQPDLNRYHTSYSYYYGTNPPDELLYPRGKRVDAVTASNKVAEVAAVGAQESNLFPSFSRMYEEVPQY